MDILASLRENICEVTFTKANGDERTMICTLIPDFLPGDPSSDPYPLQLTTNKDIVTVWDLEEDAWRSFKPSRVTNIEFSKE